MFALFAFVTLVSQGSVQARDYDTTGLKDKIHHLRKSADSLRKEANRLRDSMSNNQWKNFKSFKIPDDFKKWQLEIPQNIPEIPEPPNPQYKYWTPQMKPFELPPSQEKEKKPIEHFRGWYFEQLADNSE
jgi:hypothetical protein